MTAVAEARPAIAGRRWTPPEGIAIRGTVLLLPGRGEHPGVYERFGTRLATDGYLVFAPAEPASLGRRLTEEERAGLVGPVVLAGSDTGALWALTLAARTQLPVAGLILAGIPDTQADDSGKPAPATWDEELDARTACPSYRNRLGRDTKLQRGALARPIPFELRGARGEAADLDVPVLVLHGGDDRIASVTEAGALAARLRRVEFVTVAGGRHDVLNDITHRTVAARIVLWLERLRSSSGMAPLITVERT